MITFRLRLELAQLCSQVKHGSQARNDDDVDNSDESYASGTRIDVGPSDSRASMVYGYGNLVGRGAVVLIQSQISAAKVD